MGKVAWLWTTIVGSCGLAAGLWVGLRIGTGYDAGTDASASVGLAGLLGAAGIARAQLDIPSRRSKHNYQPNMGNLAGVKQTFADRVDEWAKLETLVRRSMKRGKIQLVLVIHGMPGVGKTEFALHATYKLVDQLFKSDRGRTDMLVRQVDLNGYLDVGQTNPVDALQALLSGQDGLSQRLAKMNFGELKGEWRNYLQGKLLILFLDNAADAEQVLPFRPGGSSYIILVTSRDKLQSLVAEGAKELRLDVLSQDGAMEMMENIAARPPSASDQEALKEIAHLCGGLPEAIEIAVKSLAGEDGLPFADQAALLAQNPNRLLAADEYAQGSGGTRGVAESFDFSYMKLNETARLVLKRMAISPVLSLDVAAVTALADLPRREVESGLAALARESLIAKNSEKIKAGLGARYEMHALIRRYVKILAERDDPARNREAISRLLAYYWDAAAQADSLLTRQPAPDAIERPLPVIRQEFTDPRSVINWTKDELPNLLACVDHVVRQAEDSDAREENGWVMLFASALAGILRNEGRWRRSIDLQAQAAISAAKIGVPLGVANALSERGMLYRLTGELTYAAVDLALAIFIYRQLGGPVSQIGEAHALNTYGVVLDQLHRRDESCHRLSEALRIFRQGNDPLGEANVLHDQGMAEYFAKNYDAAAHLIGQALELYRRVDQRLGMAHAYSNLAQAQQRAGAGRESADSLEAAGLLYRELGNRLGAVNVQIQLGAVLRQQDRRKAVQTLVEAEELSTALGNQATRIAALDELGEIYLAGGDGVAAAEAWSRALRIAREHGMKREEVMLTGKVTHVRPPSGSRSLVRWVKSLTRWKR